MKRRNYIPQSEYDVLDGCYGTVMGRCGNGVYVELDNGQMAYSYKFASLRPGCQVLCTVQKLATGFRNILVSIDSVLEYAA